MTLRRIDTFDTGDAEKLSEQLTQLENNIAGEFGKFSPRMTWSDWSALPTVQSAYGKTLRLDTATVAILAALPSISNETAGQIVGIVRKGANSVTVYPIESTALIDGLASAALLANGLYLYTHDGTEWYRV